MNNDAIVCHACGTRFRAGRKRCPRCRAFVPVPQSGPQPGGLAPKIAIGVLLLAVLAVVLLYSLKRGEPIAPATSAVRQDPLAGRRGPDAGEARSDQSGAPVIPVDPAPVESSRLPANVSTADDAGALAALQARVEENPQDSAALFGAGRTLLRLGRASEAVGPLRQAMEQEPTAWDRAFEYGYACARAELWRDALDGFRRARAHDPTDAATSYDLALSLHKTGAFEAAAEEYAAASALDPTAADPRLGRAIVLDRLGKATEAASEYEETLRLLPAGPNADRVRARIGAIRGQSSGESGDSPVVRAPQPVKIDGRNHL